MGVDQHIDWRIAAASTLEWWHDAGVDVLVGDNPRDWLAVPVRAEAVATPAALDAPEAPVAAPLPATLADYLAWRAGPDAPEASWGSPFVMPQGDPGAPLMLLSDMPDADGLIGGAAGQLLDRMLAAIGLDRASVHIATLAFARPASGRITPEVEVRLGELARHHISLVAPRRLLLLGQSAAHAILADVEGPVRGRLHSLNHDGRNSTVVASLHPRFLLDRPAAKAESWRDLQLLIPGS